MTHSWPTNSSPRTSFLDDDDEENSSAKRSFFLIMAPAAASRQWRLVRLQRGASPPRIKEAPPDPGLVRCRLGYNQLQVGGGAGAAGVVATFCSVSVAPHQPETCSVRAIVRAS